MHILKCECTAYIVNLVFRLGVCLMWCGLYIIHIIRYVIDSVARITTR